MNSGNSRPDAELSCRPAQDDAIDSGASDDHGSGTPAQPAGAQRPLQDIQDIIDKLAAVTQQLRRPTSSLHGSPRLAGCDRGLIRAELAYPAYPSRVRIRRALSGGLRAAARSKAKARM
jgi:hypothetical protein